MSRAIFALCLLHILISNHQQVYCHEAAKLFVGVRDIVYGRRIPGFTGELYKQDENKHGWDLISQTVASETGSINFGITEDIFTQGTYRLVYYLENYYASYNLSTFYPYTEVIFEKPSDDNEEYTIPLLASPYGYTAYKGSSAK